MSGYDTTINYTQKYYDDIFTYLLQGAYGLGLLNSTDVTVNADGTLSDGNNIENVIIMEYSILAFKISEMYIDLTTVNNGQNPNLAPVEDTINNIVEPTDALAILCTPFIGPPYSANYATTEIDFYVATPNTVNVDIPQGTQIQSEADPTIVFQTITDSTLLSGTNDVIVPVICQTTGPSGNVLPNTLTVMVSPIVGVDSVTNSSNASGGSLGETSANYLSRFNQWKYSNVRGTFDALGSAINSVPAVMGYYINPHPFVPVGTGGYYQYGLTDVTIDPPLESVLNDVISAINLWKAVDENVVVTGVSEETVTLNATINVDLDSAVSYSDSDKARFGQLAQNCIETYIDGGFDINGNVRLELGIGQYVVLSQVIGYVLSQIPQIVDMYFTSPITNITILPTEKAVAGTITVTVI